MAAPTYIVAVPMLTVLVAATVSDLRTRRIPNALSLGGAALGLLLNAVMLGPGALGLAVLGWVVCFLCFLPLYVSGGTAAGDVKLAAMVGAFLGPVNGFMACLFTLIAGALLAAVSVAGRRIDGQGARSAGTNSTSAATVKSASTSRLDKIPYATAIALGGAAVVLQPAWVTNLLQ